MSFDDGLYSVPSALIGQCVDIRATVTAVKVFDSHQRIASHVCSYGRGTKQ